MTQKYIKIKDLQIPINIKNYSNSKSVKIYFKGNILNITKPTRLSAKKMMEILKVEEQNIYDKYKKIISSEISSIKQWESGEKIFYKGKEFSIVREYTNKLEENVEIDEEKEQLIVKVPENVEQDVIKKSIDKIIKKILKKNTEILILQRLPFWCEITGFKYNEVKIRDATTRYGSCMPNKKNLYFSSRLIMLSIDKVDAIIVHELCHFIEANHSKQFYHEIEKRIPDYRDKEKRLKEIII